MKIKIHVSGVFVNLCLLPTARQLTDSSINFHINENILQYVMYIPSGWRQSLKLRHLDSTADNYEEDEVTNSMDKLQNTNFIHIGYSNCMFIAIGTREASITANSYLKRILNNNNASVVKIVVTSEIKNNCAPEIHPLGVKDQYKPDTIGPLSAGSPPDHCGTYECY